MPLSRLENFLRSPKGNVIYVDPNSFDATDSYENRGDSATRPFKTIQRALIESSRFSYQSGFNNDLNDRTTILVSSGVHYIDNRPGLSITNSSGTAIYKKRTGKDNWSVEIFNEFTENSNFDIFDSANDLYKFNSVEGGVILPRGTSIVGLDLRKTKIRPLYVPDPLNSDVDRSSIFKITGNCYFTSFTFFDADPAVAVYKDYDYNLVVPKFSHHKLTAFTYADGVNKVRLGTVQTDLTDLQMYYYKVANAFGLSSGRSIPDYPVNQDIEPIVDEYRIVGILEENLIGISSIRSGNGTGGGILNEITVTTRDLVTDTETPHNLTANTPILISGVSVNPESYNGSFIVNSVVGPNTFTYITPSIPVNKLPSTSQINSAVIKVESDNTSSSSPYIFNCSLRSVYGMCGLWADGSKADGFKSVVVAQFTGISLQKDDNAFLIYSQTNNNYITNNDLAQNSLEKPLHTNPYSIYNPEFENFHIRVSNNSFIQCVSIFAIGFAKHFIAESGGDMSITNSNSNFGALALESSGFRDSSFDRDDVGYITHIIPPRQLPYNASDVVYTSLDVGLIADASNTTNKRLYLYEYRDINQIPPSKVDGFKIGAKRNDKLAVILGDSSTEYTSPILMETFSGSGVSSPKEYNVQRVNNINTIVSDTFTLEQSHQLKNGEKIRILSNTGQMPDGIDPNVIYYAIRVNSTQIKLAYNYNDAIAATPSNITGISNNGGILKIVSSVTDKVPGDIGHPIQWDSTVKNWYIISSTDSSNQIYSKIYELGVGTLGTSTQNSTFVRQIESRSIEDRLYKVRYVIPKEYTNIRVPGIGFVLQESKTVGVSTSSVNSSSTLKISDRRNEKIISSISAGSISNNSQTVTVKTEFPHKFILGDTVKVNNVKSTFNVDATGITSTFNGIYDITNIIDSHTFNYKIAGISTNPGSFINNLNTRNSNTISFLPTVSRNRYKNTFVVYRVDTIKNHIPGVNGQDGIYHLTLISSNVKTSDKIGYGISAITYNQDVRNLYPQIDRDNFVVDPQPAVSYSDHKILGKVLTNDKRNSITKETIEYFVQNNSVGFGITNITLSGIGYTTITIQTDVEHKLNSIKAINLTSGGSGHSGSYYGAPVSIGSTITDAVCNYTTSAGSIVGSSIEFIDSGSSFGIGQTIGIGTLGGEATITEINSNLNDGIELGGFIQNDLNGVFKIISIPDSKTIVLQSTSGFTTYTPNANSRIPFGMLSSKGVSISSIEFNDISTGIVTVTSSTAHGLLEGNNFKIIGSGSTIYDSNFVVDNVVGLTTFTFNVGIATTNPISSQGTLYRRLLNPNGKSSGRSGENLGNRANYIFAGISTTLSSITDTQITFTSSNGFIRGDFIQIGGEVLRLTKFVGSNTYSVDRGLFGTLKESHSSGEVIYKIKVIPVELRRPSFMRASGHTFEYLGYGPGNYSTSVPQKQTRKLSDDEILVSQSKKISGGTVVYSGMNDLGEFYYGAKRVSSVTGQETIIEAPVISFTGDDVDGTSDPSKLSGIFDDILIRQKLTVEGGENGNETSIFYGPVRFQNSISLQNDLSTKTLTLNNKKFTVNDKTGTLNLGNISYVGVANSYIGEVLLSSGWRRWGLISNSATTWDINLDSLTVTNIDVLNNLTVNGISFSGSLIDELNVNKLKVVGISTLQGPIYGLNDNVLFYNNISVTNGITTTGIGSDGRTIDLGRTITYPNYGLRLTREVGTGNVKSRILHRGTESLEIRSEDSGGSIELTNAGISTLSLDSNGVITVSRSINSGGSGGSHLAILNRNTGTSADAVLSWRNGSNRFWFSGIDASDSNWKLAYSEPSVGINLQDFNSNSIKVSVSPDGTIKAKDFATTSGGSISNKAIVFSIIFGL